MAGLSGAAQPLNPKSANELIAGLQASAAPPNPQTPSQRQDPANMVLLDRHRIRISIERAQEHEQDPALLAIYKSMHGITEQMILGMDGQSVYQYAMHSLGPPVPPDGMPQAPPPPGAPGGAGAPPGPPGGVPGPAAAPPPGPPGPPLG